MSFLGNRISFQLYYPDFDSPNISTQFRTVSNTSLEFPSIEQFDIGSSLFNPVNADIDFTDNSINIVYLEGSGGFFDQFASGINGYYFHDVDGAIEPITNVEVQTFANSIDVTTEDISFGEDWIFVNLDGAKYTTGNGIFLDVDFGEQSAGPDLTVRDLVLSDTTLEPGDGFDFAYRFGNLGGEDVLIDVDLYISPDSRITTSDRYLDGVNHTNWALGQTHLFDSANSSNISQAIIPADLVPGTYYIGLIADDDDSALESNENNNVSNAVRIVVEESNSEPPEPTMPADDFSLPIWQSDIDAKGLEIAVHWTSYEGHGGIDFGGRDESGNSLLGVNVRATADGVLYRAADHPQFGRLVIIDHGNNLYSLYSHLSKYDQRLNEFISASGDPSQALPTVNISAGDVIGEVGSSGSASTGPHLHFSILDLSGGGTLNRTGALGVSEGAVSAFYWSILGSRNEQYWDVERISPELSRIADHPVHIADGLIDNPSESGDTTWDIIVDDGSRGTFRSEGSIERPGDKDWFEFVVSEPSDYEVSVISRNNGTFKPIQDSFFSIKTSTEVDGEYQNIPESDLNRNDNVGDIETLQWTARESGSFFIVVGGGGSDFRNQTGDYFIEISRGNAISGEEVREIALLYEAGLDRDGEIDIIGLNYWIDQREQGLSAEALAQAFLDSPEFAAMAGDPDTLSNRELVEALYRNVLNREGEANGVAFWTNIVGGSNMNRADLLLSFASSPENISGSTFIETLEEVSPGEWAFV